MKLAGLLAEAGIEGIAVGTAHSRLQSGEVLGFHLIKFGV